MRLAVSCVSGIHWRRLRFIDPADYKVAFWREWEKLLWERGFVLKHTTREAAEKWGGLWIATVDSFVYPKPVTHVVVMQGDKLYYDSAQIKRRRAPTKLRANPILVLPLEDV